MSLLLTITFHLLFKTYLLGYIDGFFVAGNITSSASTNITFFNGAFS